LRAGNHSITIEKHPMTTSDRIVAAALELFAAQGYRGTSVGEIEAAAGLSPRSGALYKHFPSKAAVLEAAIQQRSDDVDAAESVIRLLPLGDIRAELTLLARLALAQLARERSLARIIMKEGDQFPALVSAFYERSVRRGFEQAARYWRDTYERAGVEPPAGDEAASVMLAGLVFYRVHDFMFGRPVGEHDEEAYVQAWVEAALVQFRAAGIDVDSKQEAHHE